ncbi:MAG: hypothetical protein WA746_06610 [Isosphaeraceae bacterium]
MNAVLPAYIKGPASSDSSASGIGTANLHCALTDTVQTRWRPKILDWL